MPVNIQDRIDAIEWAKSILQENPLVLDTETSGLMADSEIVEIAIAEADTRNVLLNTRVKCPHPNKLLIEDDRGICSADIHHIYPNDLVNAPEWSMIYDELCAITRGRRVVIFNANFDKPRIRYMCDVYGLLPPRAKSIECAMLQAAQFNQIWNDRKGGYKWPRLEDGNHSALGDVYETIKLLQTMAAAE